MNIPVKNISSVLVKDVCWRFQKVGNVTYDLYELDKRNRTVTPHEPEKIRDHSHVLFDLINYRWTQKLEEFNHSPRISKKVRGTDREEIKRKSLSKFKKYLDLENPHHICFHTGKPIDPNNLSIDHVIPWSYMFADDLWNLVYVDRSINSSKSNRIPDEKTIEKLETRNLHLSKLITLNKIKGKDTEELHLSIDEGFVRKFWVGCLG